MLDPPGFHRPHPILVTHVASADGSHKRGLRVYCEARATSVPLDVCRHCASCRELLTDDTGEERWVCCSPPATRDAGELGLAVGDALQEGVVAVEEDVLLRDVVALFVGRRVRVVVVVDDRGQVTGMVHESHLIPEILACNGPGQSPTLARRELAGATAAAIMSSARPVPESMPLRGALEEMAASRHQRLVAVDAEGLPVGMLVDVHALHALRTSVRKG